MGKAWWVSGFWSYLACCFSALCKYVCTHSLALQIKAEDCLKLEEERVSNYMHQSTRVGLLKEVETELLQQHQTTLLEKEQSGCAALLQDDKVIPCYYFMYLVLKCNLCRCPCCAVQPYSPSPAIAAWLASTCSHLQDDAVEARHVAY